MTCPPGSMKFSDQPLIAELPVLVIVRFDVRPVFHDWIVSVTWQDDEPLVGVVVGGVPTVVVVVGGGGLPLRPKNWIASAAMPDTGDAVRLDLRAVPGACPAGLRGVRGRRGLTHPEYVRPLFDLLAEVRVEQRGVRGAVPQLDS